jgi:hypothetical protein
MRLTMKPGVDRACTGTLPQARARSKMASATPASVCRPDTTSTSFISGTGLKKCMPTSRPDAAGPLAMAVTEIDEVLVASTHCGDTIGFELLEQAALEVQVLDDGLDHQAHVAALSSADSGTMRASAALASSAAACPWPPGSRGALERALASAAAPGRVSATAHRMAGLGGHLRDAGAHDAGADHQQRGAFEVDGHVSEFQGAGRLARKAAKPSRASCVPRTRAMVCAVSSRTAGVTGPTASCARAA